MGGKTEYNVLPNHAVPNVWPIKIGSNLTMLEASILEEGGFKVACFGEYHGVY